MRLLPGETANPEVLGRCAALITKSLRSYDIPARIDNERFAALLLDADYHNAATVAFRIKGDLQLRVPAAGKWQAGVATFRRDGVDADSLIQAALRRLEEDARAAA
jgi:PleD family two-component response regulator